MSEPILIQQQRQILREFRQAVTTRRQQEQEAGSRYREERKQADTLLEQIKEKARKSQEEKVTRAQKRYEETAKAAEKAWTQAQERAADAQTQSDKDLKQCMDYVLNTGLSTALIPAKILPAPPEGMTGDEDPAQMLEQSLRAVKRESEAVVKSVVELWRWRETWQRRRDRAIGIAAVAALAGLLLFSHNYVQVQEMARQATAMALHSTYVASSTATAQAYANRPQISAENASKVALFNSIQAHDNRATCVKFSPDGRLLASGSDDTTIKIWDAATGRRLFTLQGHTSYVYGLAFSPDGTLLASVSEDNTLRIWNVADGTLIRVLEGSAGVAFSPNGQVLASGLRNGSIKLWRVADGALLRTLSRHSDFVADVAFSPDGRTLASTSADATVRLWRVSDGTRLHTLEGHTAAVWSVAFSPDGALLASGSGDGTVRLWRVNDSSKVRTVDTGTDGVGNVIFNPHGDILVAIAGNWGKPTIWIWRVSDWKLLHKIEVDGAEAIRDSAFDPLGRFFATASHDGVIRLWSVTP